MEMIPQGGEALLEGGELLSPWRRVRCECFPRRGEPVEEILMLGEHMPQDHGIGAVNRGHEHSPAEIFSES